MGLFSKKPKSIIVEHPDHKAAAEDKAMDRLEELLPMVEPLPQPLLQLAQPPKLDPPPRLERAEKPAKPVDDPVDGLARRKRETPGNSMFPGISFGGGGRI